jgi:hypothetical protein
MYIRNEDEAVSESTKPYFTLTVGGSAIMTKLNLESNIGGDVAFEFLPSL